VTFHSYTPQISSLFQTINYHQLNTHIGGHHENHNLRIDILVSILLMG